MYILDIIDYKGNQIAYSLSKNNNTIRYGVILSLEDLNKEFSIKLTRDTYKGRKRVYLEKI